MINPISIEALYQIYLQHPIVQTDTRKLSSGCIFFALKGPSFNGNAFANNALQLGAAFVVVDDESVVKDERYLFTTDVLSCLQALALYHRKQFKVPFLAITGSNGKTTTKELVSAVLRRKYTLYATVGNLNNHIGVPLTLLSVRNDAELVIIEMGANHQHEIEAYCKMVLPTHAIITNCGKAHIEGFGGEAGVRKGKGELYDFIRANDGTIFINADLDYLQIMAQGITKQISYGTSNAIISGIALMHDFFLKVQMTNPFAGKLLNTHLVGAYNLPNVLVAVAVGHYFNVPFDDIAFAIANYDPDNSRSQLMKLGTNNIILDAYNANPTSMIAAIDNFAALQLPNKRLWIGGMKEMGEAQLQEHLALVQHIGKYNWLQVVLVGKEFQGIAQNYSWFPTSEDAYATLSKTEITNSNLLIKGSRGSKMEVLLNIFKN